MFADEDLRAMDATEREALLRRLLEIHRAPAIAEGSVARERYVALTTVAAAFLLFWVIYLAATLPRTYTTGHWRLTWVGFDCALAFLLAATALLALWRRQLVIVTSLVTGALLVCDAWFDSTTAAGSDRWLSFLSVPVETVLAGVLFGTAGMFLHHLGTMTVPDEARLSSWALRPLSGLRPGGFGSTARALRISPQKDMGRN
jgi:hypothetical protein